MLKLGRLCTFKIKDTTKSLQVRLYLAVSYSKHMTGKLAEYQVAQWLITLLLRFLGKKSLCVGGCVFILSYFRLRARTQFYCAVRLTSGDLSSSLFLPWNLISVFGWTDKHLYLQQQRSHSRPWLWCFFLEKTQCFLGLEKTNTALRSRDNRVWGESAAHSPPFELIVWEILD